MEYRGAGEEAGREERQRLSGTRGGGGGHLRERVERGRRKGSKEQEAEGWGSKCKTAARVQTPGGCRGKGRLREGAARWCVTMNPK